MMTDDARTPEKESQAMSSIDSKEEEKLDAEADTSKIPCAKANRNKQKAHRANMRRLLQVTGKKKVCMDAWFRNMNTGVKEVLKSDKLMRGIRDTVIAGDNTQPLT